jgi:predicted nucleotidyltransferase
MDDAIRDVLSADERVGYALLFGSQARDAATPFSDVDIAIGAKTGARLDRRGIGDLIVLDDVLDGAAHGR